MELTMNVAADGDWRRYVDYVALLDEKLSRFVA